MSRGKNLPTQSSREKKHSPSFRRNATSDRATSPSAIRSNARGTEFHYAVNLRISSVESGIICHSDPRHTHTYTGLGAFNFYFDHLLPNDDGFSLPDIWDGYFHITLLKFRLRANSIGGHCQEIENNLAAYITENYHPVDDDPGLFPCYFRAEGLRIWDGARRFDDQQGRDFVVLELEDRNHVWNQLEPLLRIIQEGVEHVHGECERSIEDQRRMLHVTVRKYNDNNGYWTQQRIVNSRISERVRRNPLDIPCVALDISPARRQASARQEQWWVGVTGEKRACPNCHETYLDESPGYCRACRTEGNDHQCSGCYRVETRPRAWAGYCPGCWEYERIRPLWSTQDANN